MCYFLSESAPSVEARRFKNHRKDALKCRPFHMKDLDEAFKSLPCEPAMIGDLSFGSFQWDIVHRSNRVRDISCSGANCSGGICLTDGRSRVRCAVSLRFKSASREDLGSSSQCLSPVGALVYDNFPASFMTKATRLATCFPKRELSAE